MAQQNGRIQVFESLTPRQQRSTLVGILVFVAIIMSIVNALANGEADWRGADLRNVEFDEHPCADGTLHGRLHDYYRLRGTPFGHCTICVNKSPLQGGERI